MTVSATELSIHPTAPPHAIRTDRASRRATHAERWSARASGGRGDRRAHRLPGYAVLSTDGGSRGNPNPAAIGYVLTGRDDTLLAAHGEAIGVARRRAARAGKAWRGAQQGQDRSTAASPRRTSRTNRATHARVLSVPRLTSMLRTPLSDQYTSVIAEDHRQPARGHHAEPGDRRHGPVPGGSRVGQQEDRDRSAILYGHRGTECTVTLFLGAGRVVGADSFDFRPSGRSRLRSSGARAPTRARTDWRGSRRSAPPSRFGS
jgi:hypothetical protein